VTGLRAAHLLLRAGLFQEQSAINRVLDELGEDILFLTIALTNDQVTNLHKRFLDAFYEEEFDMKTGKPASLKGRDMPTRPKIRAYIFRVVGTGLDATKSTDSVTTIFKMYSGYVHAASPQIMDMYEPPVGFHVAGMRDNVEKAEGHERDLWNYFFRGIGDAIFVGKAFGDVSLVEGLEVFLSEFTQRKPPKPPR
jgi:hypothetical protein